MKIRQRILSRALVLALPAAALGALVGQSVHRGQEVAAAEQAKTNQMKTAPPVSSEVAANGVKSADASRKPAQVAESASGKVVRVSNGDAGGCLVDPTALEDLQRQRDSASKRDQALQAREQELAARERALQEEMGRIQTLRDEITAVENLKQSDNEEKIAKFVATLEGMNPKAGSKLLGSVSEALAVTAMTRLDTAKLSKIMNIMEAEKSSRLSELLTGAARVRLKAKASNGASAAASPGQTAGVSAKGGDNTNGNVKNNSNAASTEQSGTGNDGRSPAQKK